MFANLSFSFLILYFFPSSTLSVSQPVSRQISNCLYKDRAFVLKRPYIPWGESIAISFSKFSRKDVRAHIFSGSIKQVRNHILLAIHSLPPNREAVLCHCLAWFMCNHNFSVSSLILYSKWNKDEII